VRVVDRKLGVESEIVRAALVATLEKRGSVRWDDFAYGGDALDNVDTAPVPSARFGTIDSPLNDSKLMTALQKDFADWVLRNSSVKARANTTLKVYAGPDVSRAEFMKACADAASDARDKEIAKQTGQLDRQLKTLEDKLAREERELREDEAELSHRKVEEAGTHIENVTGLFGGKRSVRRLSSSLTKRRQTEQAKADVDESLDAIALYKQQIADVEKRRAELVNEINSKWGNVVNDITEITVNPKKTDVAWMPYYSVQAGGAVFELPAFGVQ
jgi:flagellar biosynthesis chaperone FliJ